VPPAPEFDFHREIARLKSLRSKLSDLTSLREKHAVVDRDARVKRFFDSIKKGGFSRVLLASLDLDSYELFLVKCLVAAGQEHVVRVRVRAARERVGVGSELAEEHVLCAGGDD
jgi:alkylhydroperoxidase/carboxymuconolactone decarboxylase family protein YurZ